MSDSPPANTGASRDLTANMRHYLATIYRLATERFHDDASADAPLPTAALSEKLFLAPPAIGRMVGRLQKRGLLRHQPYRGLRLTEEGERAALRVLRRRRIAQAFLVAVLGYDWAEVEGESRQLAEGMSDALTQRMWEQAGRPDTCPRGEPIPSAAGMLPPQDDLPLKRADIGPQYRITRIRTDEGDRLQYIAAIGLTPGVALEVLQRAPFDGPLQLKLGPALPSAPSEYRIIGDNLAQIIFAQPMG